MNQTAPPDRPRVVLVTGAAGGLGQELVAEFASQGWQVAAGIHQRPLPALSTSIFPVSIELADTGSVTAAFDQVLARYGRLDALINNAGLTADQPLARMTETDWDRVLTVNLRGAFLCAKTALRPMLRQRAGHIINISSFSGRAGAPGQANYAAAKAGLIGLTQSLAKEAGARNVRVNAVLPGVLPTSMTDALAPERLQALVKANALGRLNSIEEVARFVVFLTALENISGQIFQLDSRVARWT